MKRIILLFVALAFISCASRTGRPNFDFGNRLAQQDVWQEAVYRWKLSLENEGESASAHNNLAVAYEHLGKFGQAEEEYKKALKLEPDHRQIKSNYERFLRKRKK